MNDILTIGSATLDIFAFKQTLNDFQPNFKVDLDKLDIFLGGGAVNTALGFRKIGFKTATYIQVGRDLIGDFILKELKKKKIKVYFDRSRKTTAISFILRVSNKDDYPFVWRGASSVLEFKDVKKIKKIKTKSLYLGPSLTKVLILKSIVQHFKKQNVPIIWNPSFYHASLGISQLKSILQNVNILILNKKECQSLTEKEDLKESLKVLKDAGPEIVVVTLEKEGSLCMFRDLVLKADIFPERQIVDRTGAGDAFAVGFTSAILLGKDIKKALVWGSANATSIIESLGANTSHLSKKDYNKLRWQKLTIREWKI